MQKPAKKPRDDRRDESGSMKKVSTMFALGK